MKRGQRDREDSMKTHTEDSTWRYKTGKKKKKKTGMMHLNMANRWLEAREKRGTVKRESGLADTFSLDIQPPET